MKRGDLVRVGHRRGESRILLWEPISGGRCLGDAVKGEHLILLDEKRARNGTFKVLHPTMGACFIHASDIEVVDETG